MDDHFPPTCRAKPIQRWQHSVVAAKSKGATRSFIGRIDIPGTHNFRSTGGYPAARGRTRDGWLYRSDALNMVPPEGLERIAELGIKLVVDLRSGIELTRCGPVSVPGAEVVNVSIYGGSHDSMMVAAGAELSLESLYKHTLIDSCTEVARAVQYVAESPGPVLVHCTAGKDRTGLVVALALASVGVRQSAIVADYTESALNLDGPWLEQAVSDLVSRGMPISNRLYQVIGGSPARTMERILDWLPAAYGSIPEYLIEHGMPPAGIGMLHSRLITAR
jgi:protein-tyrosine phosphatase